MKAFTSFVLTLFFVVAGFQVAQAAPATETPAQRAGRVAITAAYANMSQAMATGKAAPTSYYASNYSVRGTDGQIHNRVRNPADLHLLLGVSLRISEISRKTSFTWRGKDVKNITASNQVTILAKTKKGAFATPIKLFVQSQDFWTLTPRGWKIRQTVEMQKKAWANGKRVR